MKKKKTWLQVKWKKKKHTYKWQSHSMTSTRLLAWRNWTSTWLLAVTSLGIRLQRMISLCMKLCPSLHHPNLWMHLGGTTTLLLFLGFRKFGAVLFFTCHYTLWNSCKLVNLCLNVIWCCSGVSGEGCGVTIEGSAPITGEAVATPPAGDSKASPSFLFYWVLLISVIYFAFNYLSEHVEFGLFSFFCLENLLTCLKLLYLFVRI